MIKKDLVYKKKYFGCRVVHQKLFFNDEIKKTLTLKKYWLY